jgi:Methyltransferase domain
LTDEDIAKIRSSCDTFRFFSVDGGHTADHCYKDLCTSEALVASGGVVALDDGFAFEWPGVTEGLFRYLNRPGAKLAPFASTKKKVFLTQKEFCKNFADGLIAGLNARKVKYSQKDTEIVRHPTIALQLRI